MRRIFQRVNKFALAVGLAPILALGCTGSGVATLAGRVEFDGRPVVNGVVHFVPLPDGAPEAAVIREGNYRIELPVNGSYRVDVVGFEGVQTVTSSAQLAEQAQSGRSAPAVIEIPANA